MLCLKSLDYSADIAVSYHIQKINTLKILSITLTNELRIIIKLTRVAVGNIETPNAIIYYSAIKVRNFTVIESNIF